MQINSDAVEDICGICEGDGTTCKVVDEIYTGIGHGAYYLLGIDINHEIVVLFYCIQAPLVLGSRYKKGIQQLCYYILFFNVVVVV